MGYTTVEPEIEWIEPAPIALPERVPAPVLPTKTEPEKVPELVPA